MSSEKSVTKSSGGLVAPSIEDWDAVRYLVTKLWYQERKTIKNVINRLEVGYRLKVTHKTLKTKFREWGLLKNMNAEDAEDMLKAQARVEALGKQATLLVRGRVQTMRRVHTYRRLKAKRSVAGQQAVSQVEQRPSNVIALSQHPSIRPEPALRLLEKLEPVLREMQQLLRGAKDSALCVPGMISLHWTASSTETRLSEREFQYSIWEGTRAFEENNIRWAGLCWQSALLQLEDLLRQPDLDIWTTFLRCCIRLKRFGAEKVGQYFHHKLRLVRDLLPLTAPHRTLLFALTDASFDDIVQGGLFILEAKLRQIELLWPKERNAHIAYQFNLAEERFYNGYPDREAEMPKDDDFTGMDVEDIWEHANIVMGHVSKYMLLFEYQKAESLVQRCITELDKQSEGDTADPLLQMPLANLYGHLGNAQYYQRQYPRARSSFAKSLQIHQTFLTRFEEHALNPLQVHRIFTLLSWFDATQINTGIETIESYDTLKRALEAKMQDEVKARESRPWTPNTPKASPSQARNAGHYTLTIRTRAASTVTPCVPDRDKVLDMSRKVTEAKTLTSRKGNFKSSRGPGICNVRPLLPPKPPKPVSPWN